MVEVITLRELCFARVTLLLRKCSSKVPYR